MNCCHRASCVLCAEALVIREGAAVWHHAGSSHFSPWHACPESRMCHDGNARLEGLTTYPSGGSALTRGGSSTKALLRHLGGVQQEERSLSPPSPATPLVRGPGTSAEALHHTPFFCLASLFPHFFLSLSPLLFLGFINSQRDIQQAELHQCQHFVV